MRQMLLGLLLALFVLQPAQRDVALVVVGGTVITEDAQHAVLAPGAVAISGSDIVDVDRPEAIAAKYRAAETIDARDQVVLPGLINTHTHAPMVMYRGLADDLALMDWLQKYIFPAEAKTVSPEMVRIGTRLAALEMIESGTTTYADMYYYEEAIAKATREAGLRGVLGETVIQFPVADAKTPADAIARAERYIKEFKDDPLIVPAIAPHALYTNNKATLLACAALGRKYGVPIIIHLAETEDEVRIAHEQYKSTPTAYLESIGFWGPKTLAAHGVWVTDEDIAILKRRGVGVSHNPESNMKLASGAAPVTKYLAAGVALGLGTDGAASNNDLDMFEAMRQASFLAKHATHDPTAVPAQTALDMATIGGAKALAMDRLIGSLEPGKRADLITVSMASARQTPMYDAVSHLVYTTRGDDVRTTIVNGKVLMKDRQVRTLDRATVIADANRLAQRVKAAVQPQRGSGDAAFAELARQVIADRLKRNPALATDLGVHTYDAELNDYSRAGILAEAASLEAFRSRVAAIDPATLTPERQLDREQLLHGLDAGIVDIEVVRSWAKDPDRYSGAVTNAAYVVMKRSYAPAAERLKFLIARETKMPAALAEARRNLEQPPRIYTEIAIEQIDGNISFFRNDVAAAFKGVTEPALRAGFQKSNGAVIAALGDYKKYLQDELLPKSTGAFAIGPATYSRALAANEMIDLPIDRLLGIAEADRKRNEDAFQATAGAIDATKPADAVLAAIQADHPPATDLLNVTQNTLDSLRQFIVDRHIVTIPPSPPAHVKETPPFMRSTTSASMDTPGPFERAPLEAFYNMTLPDPRWPPAEQTDFMRQWYYAAIANVSVHEVYPGHYLQFLYAKDFPSDVRKVYGANTNIEGWAHYCEQMMLDEGFHGADPKYRLAQLQDALLRDVRFIVGIKMHTQGMTVEDATTLFETAGHQPHPVAVSEAKRGTSDPLYGYYTMGKLMILKLRDDYRARQGAAYTLQGFHDAFIKLGPLPLPLIRKAMLGEVGSLF